MAFSLRVRPETAERIRQFAAENEWSVSQALQTVVARGLRGTGVLADLEDREPQVHRSASLSPEQKADAAELAWWRSFAERAVVQGAPEVRPGMDVAGWTFYIRPQRDENVEIA